MDLKQIEKQFDEKFGTSPFSDKIYPVKATTIKQFYRDKIKLLLEGVVPEECLVIAMPEHIEDEDDFNKMLIHVGRTNYNKGIKDIRENIKRIEE
jgi:hypothetical protein